MHTVEYALAAIGAVILILCWRAIAKSDRTGRFATAWLAFASAALVGYETNLVSSGGASQVMLLVSLVGLAVFAMITRGALEGGRLALPLLCPAVVSASMFFSNAVGNGDTETTQLLGRLAPVLFWVVAGLLLSARRFRIEAVSVAASTALAIPLVLLPVDGESWRACDIFKCGPFGGMLTGPFLSENYFAQIACVAILLGMFAASGMLRILVAMAGIIVLYATESRTAQVALIVALLVGLAARFVKPAARRFLLPVVVLVATAASLLIAMSASPGSFSNRGAIWARALSATQENWLIGLGIDRWSRLQSAGDLPVHFPHNQVILTLFAGGALALVALVFTMVALTRPSLELPQHAQASVALLTFLLVAGVTEVVWNPTTIDGHSLPLLLGSALCGSALWAMQSPPTEAGEQILNVDPRKGKRGHR